MTEHALSPKRPLVPPIPSLKLYADAGSTVYCQIATNNFQGQVDANCGFSGYLVDQP